MPVVGLGEEAAEGRRVLAGLGLGGARRLEPLGEAVERRADPEARP